MHFTPAEAIRLIDEGGVDAAVIHPPALDPNSTPLALQAVRDYPPRPFAIMGAHRLLFPPPNGSPRACGHVPAAQGERPLLYRGQCQASPHHLIPPAVLRFGSPVTRGSRFSSRSAPGRLMMG